MKGFSFALSIVFLGLSACTSSVTPESTGGPDYEAIAEDMARGGAVITQFGTPEGVEPNFLTTGLVDDRRWFESEEGVAQREALARAAITVSLLVQEAPTWQEADDALQSYLASPDKQVEALAPHLLSQLAALAMVNHTDLLATEQPAPEARLDAASHYLSILVENRNPDAVLMARLLEFVAPSWDRVDLVVAASIALAAHDAQQARLNACDDCELFDAIARRNGDRTKEARQILIKFAS